MKNNSLAIQMQGHNEPIRNPRPMRYEEEEKKSSLINTKSYDQINSNKNKGAKQWSGDDLI